MALEQEWDTYQRELPNLISKEGKFALIQGDQILDTLDSYEDAMKQGYLRFALDKPFMVQQINAVEPVQYFTRPLGGVECRT